jgi:hypothetical protein
MRRSDLHAWDGPIGDPSGGVADDGRGRIYCDPVTGLIVAGTTLVSGAMSSNAQEDAANAAAGAQSAASAADIAERKRQFDEIQKLLAPYVNAGTSALSGQQDLIGINGADKQQAAIQALQGSPQFAALTKQGEDAILANASATGGLRGGNVQQALAQFRPQILSQLIDQQYGRLGGLTSIGQNAAAGVGNAGLQTTQGISAALQQQGAAQAGAALAAGKAEAGMWNQPMQLLGSYVGLGGGKLLGIPGAKF